MPVELYLIEGIAPGYRLQNLSQLEKLDVPKPLCWCRFHFWIIIGAHGLPISL